MKICNRCGKEKPIKEFREQKGRNTRRSNCRECDTARHAEWRVKNKEHLRKYNQNRYIKNTDRWASHIWRKYKMKPEDYQNLLKSQGDKCAICGNQNPHHKQGRFNIDHCHKTGVIRGLLCWRCNVAIGKMEDNPSRLRKAAKYIEAFL